MITKSMYLTVSVLALSGYNSIVSQEKPVDEGVEIPEHIDQEEADDEVTKTVYNLSACTVKGDRVVDIHTINLDPMHAYTSPKPKRPAQTFSHKNDPIPAEKVSQGSTQKPYSAPQESWFSRAGQWSDEKCDAGVAAITNHPLVSVAATAGLVAAGALVGAYNKDLREGIKSRYRRVQEQSTDTYYDILERYAAPAVFRWEELNEASLTHGDIARVATAGLVGYGSYKGLSKLNNACDISGKMGKGLMHVKQSAVTALRSVNAHKGRTLLGLLGVATVVGLYKACKIMHQPDTSYAGRLQALWHSLSAEQLEKIKAPRFLDLINEAEINPIVLQESPEFIELLQAEQQELLDQIVIAYASHLKRLKEELYKTT